MACDDDKGLRIGLAGDMTGVRKYKTLIDTVRDDMGFLIRQLYGEHSASVYNKRLRSDLLLW